MLRFLIRNPNRRLAGILVTTAGLVSISDDDFRVRARIPIPAISHSSPLPLFLNQHWTSTGPRFSLVNFSVASPAASDNSNKVVSDETEDNSECIRGCLGRNAIAKAAAKAGPAVVNISVSSRIDGRFGHFIGKDVPFGATIDSDGNSFTEKGVGSGAIIDPDGTILTCAHVVVDKVGSTKLSERKVEVKLQDGREYVGTVINADLQSDIAILKIKSKTPLPYLKIGNSSKLRPGDWVVAVGCPLTLQNTVTAGIISCVDRKSRDLGLRGIQREYLQTDCAINEGNSGGPLVNLDGEIVGITLMKVQNANGLGFAVPIDSAVKIIDHFKKHGRVVRPWVGLKVLELNDLVIQQLKERDPSFPDVQKGVLVPMVTPRSPGDRAGFRPGDVMIELDGKPVKSTKEIFEILGDKVGVKMEARVVRANKEVVLTVIPEEADG